MIIPVYNVEPYLRQCLDSVVNQTLKDIEIICINDGSTDGSLSILEEYAARDKRITILNQENSGAGGARNKGLKVARGDYLSFLDADDFFKPGMLEKAYCKCKKTRADFAVFRSDCFHDSTHYFEPCGWTINESLLPAKDVFTFQDIKHDLFRVFIGWAWDKLYKTEFVLLNKLQFQELPNTEDLFFVFTALVKAENITVLDEVLAHHRKRMGSVSATREKSPECFYPALLALKDELQASGHYHKLKQDYINYALHFSLWNLFTVDLVSFKKLYHRLKSEYFEGLGIPDQHAGYFYHHSDYRQYQKINKMPLPLYLGTTLVPRLLLKCITYWKLNGFKHAFSMGVSRTSQWRHFYGKKRRA